MARTQEEIVANMRNLAPAGTGLVSNYRLDDGYGEIAYDSAGTNHGRITGARWTAGKN